MASSSREPQPEGWDELPEMLFQRVMEKMGWARSDSAAVRLVSRRWRAMHDKNCKRLTCRPGVTDEAFISLLGRMPALTCLNVGWVKSLTADGLRAVGSLTNLTNLYFISCDKVTDAVLRDLRGLTALRLLHLHDTSTTGPGQYNLKAAIPGLVIRA
jgi:hypothetical protein